MATELTLSFGPVVSDFISAVALGKAEEIAAFSPRGEGKTWGALAAMIAHAQQHQLAGFPLPVLWAGVTDTLQSHKDKTIESLLAPGWHGVWQVIDQGHEAQCIIDGQLLVRIRLFGVEDRGAMARLRRECHAVWFEEPAPAMDISSGISETAWDFAIPSARLPSHCNPSMMTANYPDVDHWTWQRFHERKHKNTMMFRVPKGESPHITQAQREKWAEALSGRPDLQRRLLEGKPGMVILGEQVAVGFNEDVHVPRSLALKPDPTATLWLGQDGGLTPTTVIGQREGPRVKILAALYSEHDGLLQHMRGLVLPWLSEHTPWALDNREAIVVVYDPSMDSDGQGDTEANPIKIMRRMLPAQYRPGPSKWGPRHEALMNVLGSMVKGEPALQVDPVQARGLMRALNGGWHYATDPGGRIKGDEPVKDHPHSDHGDAFCYLLCGMSPGKTTQPPRKAYMARGGTNTAHQLHKPLRVQPGVGVLIPTRAW